MTVIGTAGHVDHGKSALVQALTGIDPDRLREEKERGLTIDLGFAWLTLPSGREASIVDVPGHERFIKNMLAGAGGVDLAILVVAGDEGPMPQTREHLAILDLLDVPAGLVVINKIDLVEPEYADLVEAELEDVLKGSRLEGAPILRASAVTGEGLPALLAAIDSALDRTPPKRDLGRPRLPIDRAFTIQGFGAVVTGTLVDGALEVGQEIELQPGGVRARIRGLQRHRTKVGRLEPGTRAAVNLNGVRSEDIRRGMVLALPRAIVPAYAVDVRLSAPPILAHSLAHDAGVTFLSATSESEAKLRLLDREELLPGDSAWGQVVLTTPLPLVRGDHFVVRTPNETAAGGIIVAINPRRHRRHHAETLASLERQLAGSPSDRLVDLLLAGPLAPNVAREALRLEPGPFEQARDEAVDQGAVTVASGRLVATTWLDSAVGRLAAAVDEFLAANPLRMAAPREHLRSALRMGPAEFEMVVTQGLARGGIDERAASSLGRRGYEPQLSPRQQAQVERFLAGLRAGRYSPPTAEFPDPPLLAYLEERGLAVNAGAGVVYDAGVYAEMVAAVKGYIAEHGAVSLAEARDLFQTSRKYAQAFLEHLDSTRVTRRSGDLRTLR